ncbi:hypothetical protein D3C85_1885710 [compost metagenome]
MRIVADTFFNAISLRSISILFSFSESIFTIEIDTEPLLFFEADRDNAGRDFPLSLYKGAVNFIGSNVAS